MASGASAAPGTAPGKSAAKARNGFLDTMRAIALVRVIIWHALATPFISWIVCSMPAMFFVAGSLLAGSLDRRPAVPLIKSRLRRLLIPFWAYGAVVLFVLAMVHQMEPSAATAIPGWGLLRWVVPLLDPHGSAWEEGWATTPLWYLRCYLWLMLLSPVLRKAHRRWGLRVLLVPAALVFVVDALIRNPALSPALYPARWYLGDLTTYSFFLMLGFSHYDGVFTAVTRRARLEWAFIGGLAALIWVETIPVDQNVVNNSYPLLLFVGIAWLALFLAAEQWISAAPSHRVAGPIVRWLGARSLTVYLWHPPMIVFGYLTLTHLFPTAPPVAVLPFVGVYVVICAVLFGRIEDFAAKRPARWWPNYSGETPLRMRYAGARLRDLTRPVHAIPPVAGVVGGIMVGAALLAFAVPQGSTPAAVGQTVAAAPAVASPATGAAPSTTPTAATGTTPRAAHVSAPLPAPLKAQILAAVEHFRAVHGVSGITLGVSLRNGMSGAVSGGTEADGSALNVNTVFPITSVTKTMTAAVILSLVQAHKIGLDAKLPPLTAVPGLSYAGKVTVRQLLNHTAGVIPYDQTRTYPLYATKAITPVEALKMSSAAALQWKPGTRDGYSNSGYITLGLLAAQLGGAPYPALVVKYVSQPAGLTHTLLDTRPEAGHIGFSAGGMVSTVGDLLKWGAALYRDGTILKPAMLGQMLDVNNPFSVGLGAWPICPCHRGARYPYTSIGHNGGQDTLQYSPADKLVMAIYFSESIWTGHLTEVDAARLERTIRGIVDRYSAAHHLG